MLFQRIGMIERQLSSAATRKHITVGKNILRGRG